MRVPSNHLSSDPRRLVTLSEVYTTIPPGKIRCYVTGKLRKDTPEEHVRQRMARSLVEEYGYSKNDLEIEWPITMGHSKKRADIVIFNAGSLHHHENIYAIVEAKRDIIKPTNSDCGIAQLHSYLAATPNAQYGLWVGSELRSFERVVTRGQIAFIEAIDIPLANSVGRTSPSVSTLIPATDALKDVFKRCHNYIATNQGGSKEAAFHELLKVIFAKVYDEKISNPLQFYISIDEQKSRTGQIKLLTRIQLLFDKVCEDYGYIFGDGDTVNLKPNVLAYIVAELQKFSLIDTDYDYKGQAYEEIVGANSRGDRGEFFTPRNLCKLAVGMIAAVVGHNNLGSLKVLDPACGTGGFLKTYVYEIYSQLFASELRKWGDQEKAKDRAKGALASICDRNIYGADFNPVLVRAAQMNLVMNGDGSSNVFHENTLMACGEFSDKTRTKIKDGHIDIIITNPPFGEDLAVDDRHTLEQYELRTFGVTNPRSIMAPQELFVERCHRLLKPGALLAIVVPDNIVSNPSYQYIRHWIALKFRIIASISLPSEMFQPSTGTQTTLLLMRKRERAFADINEVIAVAGEEPIFMSIPRKVGHDQRGQFIPLRDEDGNVVVQEITRKKFVLAKPGKWGEEEVVAQEPVAHDDLPIVLQDFNEWLQVYGGNI